MNKTIHTGVAIAIIVVVAIVAGGLIYFSIGNKNQTINENQSLVKQTGIGQKPSENPGTATQQVAENFSSDYIEYQGNKITFSFPKSWGNLLVPKINDNGWVISPNNYGNTESGSDNSVLIGTAGLENEFSKVFSSYNYGSKKDYNEVPTISLATFPAQFADDKGGDFAGLTKKEKDKDFKPLFDVYNKKGLNGIDLSQKCFLNVDTATDCANSNYQGYWWDNFDDIADRIGVRYFENQNSDLQGIGFFDVSGQETPSTISAYKIALINPQKRILVYIYLPLNGIYSFTNSTVNVPTANEMKKAYNYLENPANYKNTQLDQFMNEVQSLVSSLKITP